MSPAQRAGKRGKRQVLLPSITYNETDLVSSILKLPLIVLYLKYAMVVTPDTMLFSLLFVYEWFSGKVTFEQSCYATSNWWQLS